LTDHRFATAPKLLLIGRPSVVNPSGKFPAIGSNDGSGFADYLWMIFFISEQVVELQQTAIIL
jgi:hypothetical protein